MRKGKWLLTAAALAVACGTLTFAACNDDGQTPGDQTTPPVITAAVDDAEIEAGGEITLTWSATEGAQVSVTYTVDGTAEDELTFSSGTAFTISEAGVYVFTFAAEGADNKTVTVTVTEAQTEPEPEPEPEPETYSVTFALGEHAAEGTQAPAAQTAEEGGKITLPAAPSAAFGYQFTGWRDGEQTYAAQAEYAADGNVTLTAQWTFVGGEYENAALDTWGQALVHPYALRDGESLVLTAKLSGAMSATAWEEGVFVQVNDGATQYFFRPANTWWSGANNEGNPNGVVSRDYEDLTALIDHDTFNTLKADTRIVVTRSGNKIFVTYDLGIVVVGFTIETVTQASADVYFILYDLAAEPNSGDTEWITASEVKVEWLPSVEKPTPDPAILASASAAEVTTAQQVTFTWRATHAADVTVTYTKDGEAASGLAFTSGVPFTISEAGVYVFTFAAEGADNKTVTVTVKEPHVHTYGAWQVMAPTQTEEGSATRTCTAEDCDLSAGATETVTLPAFGKESAYTSVEKTPATCEGAGTTTYTYADDTSISFDVTVPVLGHRFSAVSVAYDKETMSGAWTAEVVCERDEEHKLTLNMAAFDAAAWTLDTENGYTAPSHTADGSGSYYKVVEQDGYSVTVTVTGVTIPTNAEHTYAATYTADAYQAGETQIGCTYGGCEKTITVTLPALPAAGTEENGWTWTLVTAPANGADGSGTFSCTVTAGDDTASVTVTGVVVKAPVITATASADEIAPGKEVTLTWSATEGAEVAVSYTKDGDAADALQPVSGEAFVISEEGVYVFTFTADGAKPVTVTVTVVKPNLVMDESGWNVFKPDTWTFAANGATNQNTVLLANFLVRSDENASGDYRLTATFKGAATAVTGEINMGIVPWFQDAQNYVVIYLKWNPNNTGLINLQILHFINGVQYGKEGVQGWNDRWLDFDYATTLYTLNPDDEITVQVDKVYNAETKLDDYTVTISAVNKQGASVSESFTESYSVSVGKNGNIGIYSMNDTVTFSRLTVESLNETAQTPVEDEPALPPEEEEETIPEEPSVQ